LNEIARQSLPRTRPGERIPGTETCRMFENDFLEKFSRIHPITPFLFWGPFLLASLYWSRAHHALTYPMIAGLFVGGWLIWSLSEYFLHRYVFHWLKDTPRGRRIHFLLHGVHHDFPNDRDRLVMPLLTSIPIGTAYYLGIVAVFGAQYGHAVFAGFAVGYLMYDGTHFAIHHFKQTTRIGKWLKRHHMLHHHADHSGGFGVSTPLWDIVFRTMPTVKKLDATRKADAARSRA
jgi:sterol desaturase/sphingolipid hydroxylase (fatty acid hydroxylase superfamily)